MTRISFKTTFLGMLLSVTTAHVWAMDAGGDPIDFDATLRPAVTYDNVSHAQQLQREMYERIAAEETPSREHLPGTLVGQSFLVGPRTNPWSVAQYVRNELAYAGHPAPSHAEVARIIAEHNADNRGIRRGVYLTGDTLEVPPLSAFVQGEEGLDDAHEEWQAGLFAEAADLAGGVSAPAVSVDPQLAEGADSAGGMFGLDGHAEGSGSRFGQLRDWFETRQRERDATRPHDRRIRDLERQQGRLAETSSESSRAAAEAREQAAWASTARQDPLGTLLNGQFGAFFRDPRQEEQDYFDEQAVAQSRQRRLEQVERQLDAEEARRTEALAQARRMAPLVPYDERIADLEGSIRRQRDLVASQRELANEARERAAWASTARTDGFGTLLNGKFGSFFRNPQTEEQEYHDRQAVYQRRSRQLEQLERQLEAERERRAEVQGRIDAAGGAAE